MKKHAFVLIALFASICLAASVSAGTLKPGGKTSCKDAKSITLEASGTSSVGDRGNANAVLWKSSNATTISIALGPDDDNSIAGKGDGGVGMADKFSKGRKSVTLTQQSNFSRGDSIGDISGEVRITNNGTVDIIVTCG